MRKSLLILPLILSCTQVVEVIDEDREPQPDVLLVMIDTLRADHCSAFGYDRDTTPNLLQLANEGIRFTQAYSPSALTAPSTFSLFTSLYPIEHACLNNKSTLSAALPTLPEILAKAGYQTYGIASSAALAGKTGFNRGFEYYDDSWPLEESSEMAENAVRIDQLRSKPVESNGRFYLRWDRRPKFTTNHALEWLRENLDAKRPYFAFVHFMDPHEPTTPPPEYAEKFLRHGKSLHSSDSSDVDFLIDLYDAEIRYTDDQLGRLVEGVSALERERDLVVIVIADHGQGLMQHHLYSHHALLYEEAVHIPFVIHAPDRLPSGRTINTPVMNLDLAPTLLSLIGIDSSAYRFRGLDLLDIIEGDASPNPMRPVYMQRASMKPNFFVSERDAHGYKYALRKGKWKFIFTPQANYAELYDLDEDAGELRNLSEEKPEIVADMQDSLSKFLASHPPIAQSDDGLISDERREALRALGYVD